MYINDIFILYYVLFGFVGIIFSQIIDWCQIRFSESKKIFSLDFFKIYLKKFSFNVILMFTNIFLFTFLLYTYGLTNIKTYIYILLGELLLTVIFVDFKKQIIPNRLALSIFELGLMFTFIEGISNVNSIINSVLGCIIGIIIFGLITLIGLIVSRKESIGFGDLKLIASLGLIFGWRSIIIICVLAFFMGALYSLGLLIFKRKDKKEEYIPFGPFIGIASFVLMFVPLEYFFELYTSIVSLIK